MSKRLSFFCNECGKVIRFFSDGNPYYFDENGKKRYAHYPDIKKLDQCIGNDLPHICLNCGDRFVLDTMRLPGHYCPKCKTPDVIEVRNLWAETCPFCKTGSFLIDQTAKHNYNSTEKISLY